MSLKSEALVYLHAASPQALGRQRSAVTKYAKMEKIAVVDEFHDLGGKGDANAASLPGLGGLLMAIRDRGVMLVLIPGVKHLGESFAEQQSVIGLLIHRGAKVVDCASGECVSTDSSGDVRLVWETVGIVEELRKRTTTGRLQEARKSGKRSGPKEYGSYPQEAAVVDLIMQLRRERGWGQRRIANELNQRKVSNRRGGRWVPSAVQRILDRSK